MFCHNVWVLNMYVYKLFKLLADLDCKCWIHQEVSDKYETGSSQNIAKQKKMSINFEF